MSRSKRFDELQLKKLLIDRFRNIDIAAAKQDVLLFIKDADELRVWSSDFFIQITERLNPKVNPRPGFTAWLNRGNKFPK